MKKIAFILIASLLLAVVFFFIYHYFFNAGSKKGALQVTSAPESKVFLNDKFLGQTPLCKCEASDMIKSGQYTIRLVPLDKQLAEFQEKVEIADSVLTVVDRRFGKNSLSEGSIISLLPLNDKKAIELLVVSFPQGSTVVLDDNVIGTTPLLYKDVTESDHVLKVKKTGYKEKTVRIRTPMGYKLTVAAYMSTTTDVPTPTPQASSSASITPTETISPTPTPTSTVSVTILQTPTGFLRVRAAASAGAAEVGQVSPGQVFSLLDEQSGWYQIKLKDGSSGWVSGQYASKQ